MLTVVSHKADSVALRQLYP